MHQIYKSDIQSSNPNKRLWMREKKNHYTIKMYTIYIFKVIAKPKLTFVENVHTCTA